MHAAQQAATQLLPQVAEQATQKLALLREHYPCQGHSDDIVAICVAFAPPRLGGD